ncbi:hypothetical protein N7329_21585, partial [Stutzerimonas stutzeri]|nr:hypothetical protein [Stutzerimonas stutzeri]
GQKRAFTKLNLWFTGVYETRRGSSPLNRIRRVHAFIAAPVVAREPQPAVLSPPEFEKRWQTIARETGFRDRRHLREAFVRGFGVPPQAVRRDVRSMPA